VAGTIPGAKSTGKTTSVTYAGGSVEGMAMPLTAPSLMLIVYRFCEDGCAGIRGLQHS
jgi:hypothetical protein